MPDMEWAMGWDTVLQGLERRGKVLSRPPSSEDLAFCRD